MGVIQGGAVDVGLGLGSLLTNAGAPSNGVSEVQQVAITGSPTGGTFKLTFDGFTTAAIAYNAAASDVQAALRALPSIGAGGVSCSGGALPGSAVLCAFAGNLANANIDAMTADGSGLTGGSSPAVAVTTPTAGVNCTGRNAADGALLIDTTNKVLYQNQGTGTSPIWVTAGNKIAKVPLSAGVDTGGGILSWTNPEVTAIIVDRIELDVTTIATGACSVSAGTTAASATTSSANLIDTLDVHSATGVFDNITDKGSAGKSRQRLAVGKWVTISTASGASAGLVGNAFIHYHLV